MNAFLRKHALAALVLTALPFIYFYPAVTGQAVLMPGDGWSQIFGNRILAGQMLRQGTLPLWNPYIFAGMPLLGSVQAGALYPLTWLFAMLPADTAMNLLVIFTSHIALIGSWLYARRIGLGQVEALIVGVIFTFGGFMIGHLGHTNRIAAAAWLPWLLLAGEELYQRILAQRSLNEIWRWVALGSLFLMLQVLAGDPQMTWYVGLTCAAYFLFCLIRLRQRQRWLFLAASVTLALSGALLSAIQLLPGRELMKYTDRNGISYEYFSSFSLAPRLLFGMIFPYFYGGAGTSPYRVPFWGEWSPAEAACYAGLLGLLLAMIGVFGQRRQSLVWFWAAVVVVSLLLAFGSWLPFELNQWLYRLPIYNLFRASGRHRMEFLFALAVLAGFGAQFIRTCVDKTIRWIASLASLLFVALVAVTAYSYHFVGESLVFRFPRVSFAGTFANPEAFIPLIFSALSLASLWVFIWKRSAATQALVLLVLLLDLAAFGQYFEWRVTPFNYQDARTDSPAVQFIKAREAASESFRIVSQTVGPVDSRAPVYNSLNLPNVSIVRGLHSIQGYDPLRLIRQSMVAGDMALDGVISDLSAFNSDHQGLNLLNVRYLLREIPAARPKAVMLTVDGVLFNETPLDLKLATGQRADLTAGSAMASELAIISNMGRSTHLPDGTVIARIRLYTSDGRTLIRELKAGRDTAEWAYDRADVRAAIRHSRPPIAESWPENGFAGHRFLARLPLERSGIERIEIESALPETEDADLHIQRISLFDGDNQKSIPLDPLSLPPDRWRRLAGFGDVELYENLKALPRVWFAGRVEMMPSNEVLRTIKTGRLSDNSPFDPVRVALIETEDFGGRPVITPPVIENIQAEVRISSYTANRIELSTRNSQPGFLVLSEVYYRGWEAWIDGRRIPVERVDYALRGLPVPSGDHRVEFVFRSPGFRTGLSYTALGILLLLMSTVLTQPGVVSRLAKLRNNAAPRLRKLMIWQMLLLTVLVLYTIFLFTHAAYSVSGSDSSGYINTARSLLTGTLVQRAELLDALGLPDSFVSNFIPLGHVRGPRPGTIAPFYPAGMSLHMAAGAALFGWGNGPFIVSPLAAFVCLILFYLLCLELGLKRSYALAGTVILALCPVFLFFALQPMSDVLTTCWTLAALLTALRSQRNERWSLLAGFAFGLSVLTRPTNGLLLLPLAFCLRLNFRSLMLFALGGLPSALFLLGFNQTAYGHMFRSGYSTLDAAGMVKLSYIPTRFLHYVTWLSAMMSPLPLIGWVSGLFLHSTRRRRALLLTWFGAFFAFYCCYQIYDAWWYTRFLLPGIPALIIGSLLTVDYVTEWLAQRYTKTMSARRSGLLVATLFLLLTLGFSGYFIRRFEITSIGRTEYVYPRASQWAQARLPGNALVLAMEMSGVLKFYQRRPVVRWDMIEPEQWPVLKKQAQEKGRYWYALLLPHEIAEAQQRLSGRWYQVGTWQHVSLWQIEFSQ